MRTVNNVSLKVSIRNLQRASEKQFENSAENGSITAQKRFDNSADLPKEKALVNKVTFLYSYVYSGIRYNFAMVKEVHAILSLLSSLMV